MAANIYPNGFSLFRSRVGHAFAEIGKTKNLVHSSEKQCEQRRYIPLDRAAQSAGNVSGPNGNFVPDSNSHIQKKDARTARRHRAATNTGPIGFRPGQNDHRHSRETAVTSNHAPAMLWVSERRVGRSVSRRVRRNSV
jgi:hypothetical protein